MRRIACTLVLAAVACASVPAGFAFAFLALALRLLVESKPVSPAADGAGVSVVGGPSCACSGRANF